MPGSVQPLDGRPVLIVEDENIIAIAVKRWLLRAGAEVIGPVPLRAGCAPPDRGRRYRCGCAGPQPRRRHDRAANRRATPRARCAAPVCHRRCSGRAERTPRHTLAREAVRGGRAGTRCREARRASLRPPRASPHRLLTKPKLQSRQFHGPQRVERGRGDDGRFHTVPHDSRRAHIHPPDAQTAAATSRMAGNATAVRRLAAGEADSRPLPQVSRGDRPRRKPEASIRRPSRKSG